MTAKTNYVAAAMDFRTDQVLVWERADPAARVLKRYPAPRYFYVPDEDGAYTSIFGEKLKKIETESGDEWEAALRLYPARIRHESDIQPLFKVLMNEYYRVPNPVLNFAFIDIETNVRTSLGWCSVDRPYAEVNAVTVFQSWTDRYVTYILAPKKFNSKKFDDRLKRIGKQLGLDFIDRWDVKVVRTEKELLTLFIESIENADVLSGWNSEFFDIPYIIKRLELVAPKLVQRMSFIGARAPKAQTVLRFGEEATTYKLYGRAHMDYLDLFKKFAQDVKYPSYSLAAIGDAEIGVPKIEFDGTFEELYNGTYRPENVSVNQWDAVEADNDSDMLNLQRAMIETEQALRKVGSRGTDPMLSALTDGELSELFIEIDDEARIFSLCLFTGYNARDVDILVKLNLKRKLIQLVNTMAHKNTCLFENLLGTVRYVETAIVNRAHNVHKLIVRDKLGLSSDGAKVGGALVLDPYAGLHSWLGSVDINSLYPSIIRALNISPEKIVGTFISGNCSRELKTNGSRFTPLDNSNLPAWKRALIDDRIRKIKSKVTEDDEEDEDVGLQTTAGEYDWAGIIDDDDNEHTLELTREAMVRLGTDEQHLTATGKEWQAVFKEHKWAISAYGTVFEQASGLGIIPEALQAWYAERKSLQAEKKKWVLEVERLREIGASAAEIAIAEAHAEDFELLQMSEKLTLNSTYGAMLSPHFGLGRKEMGASVTACGRAITKHMIETIGKVITGNDVQITWYFGEQSKAGNGAQYGSKRTICVDPVTESVCSVTLLSDTDSCYFTTGETTLEAAIKRADEIAAHVNGTFPAFMRASFLCSSDKFDSLIRAGREIVGRRGLFLNAKKKYTIRVVDNEGVKCFKLKMMGSELKKVDTPKVIQNFLKSLMELVLDGEQGLEARVKKEEITPVEAVNLVRETSEADLEKFVNNSRKNLVFKVKNPIVLGAAKGINNLDQYYAEWQRTEKVGKGKCRLPGHVRAAINYNEVASEFEGSGAKLLKSGDKGKIFYLKPNDHDLKSIAIPVDFEQFPKWFNEHFAIDKTLTEAKMIDSKIEGIYEALNWEIPTQQRTLAKKVFAF